MKSLRQLFTRLSLKAFTIVYSVLLISSVYAKPPLAPTDLKITDVQETSVHLSWTDRSENETAFVVHKRIAKTGELFQDIVLPANTTSYLDSNLSPRTKYRYCIIATNADGRHRSNMMSVKTLDPVAPTNFKAIYITSTAITFTWTDNATDEIKYILEKKVDGEFRKVISLPPNTTSYSDSNLTPHTSYTYRLTMLSTSGKHYSSPLTVTTEDVTSVSIVALDSQASEDGDTASFQLTRTGSTNTFLQVSVSVGGTATFKQDYELSSNFKFQPQPTKDIWEIPSGQRSVIVTVDGIADSEKEGTETLQVKLQSTSKYQLGNPNEASIEIADSTKIDGAVYAWGESSNRILVPKGFSDAIDFDAGSDFSVVVKSDGTVWGWGSDAHVQLGGLVASQTGTNFTISPMKIYIPGNPKIDLISVGWGFATGEFDPHGHTLALSRDSVVYTWGSNVYGQAGKGGAGPVATFSPAIDIAAGSRHSLALTPEGKIYAWGCNYSGQLGTGYGTDFFHGGDTISETQVPTLISIIPGSTGPVVFKDISAGIEFSLALDNQGQIWAWGDNQYGQTAGPETGSLEDTFKLARPNRRVVDDGSVKFKAVAAGGYHSLALAENGTVWSWGGNQYGQLGNGTTFIPEPPFGLFYPSLLFYKPTQVPGLIDIIAVEAGKFHSLALQSDGTVWAWGLNADGQLGDGTLIDRNLPVKVSNFKGYGIAAGGNNSLGFGTLSSPGETSTAATK